MDPFQDPAKEQTLQLDHISVVQGSRFPGKSWAEGIRVEGMRSVWVSKAKSKSLFCFVLF